MEKKILDHITDLLCISGIFTSQQFSVNDVLSLGEQYF